MGSLGSPSFRLALQDAVQTGRSEQMPEVRQGRLRRRREGGRRPQMAQRLLQVLDVQQVVGQHELCRARELALLQKLPRPKVRTEGLWIWWWSGWPDDGQRRAVRQHRVCHKQTHRSN